MYKLFLLYFLALIITTSCSSLKEDIKGPISEVDSYYLCFPENDPAYSTMSAQDRTYLLKEVLVERKARNLNCEDRFKNLVTGRENLNEINQEELNKKIGKCKRSTSGPCRYE